MKVQQALRVPGSRFQDFEEPRFEDNLHMKVGRLSVYSPATFTPSPQKIFLELIFVRV